MNSVCIETPGNIYIKQIAVPVPKEGEALIRVKSAGICGSDIGAYRGTNGLVSYPRVIGHEIAGEIVSIGENKKGLKAGDRVVVDPYLFCGNCYPCSIGRTNCCNDLHVLGVHVDGGMTELITHPADMLVPIPENIPWDIAPISEPLTISLHGCHRLGLKAGETVAISGAGTIGLLAALVALAYDAKPILIDMVEERLAFARELGVKMTVNLQTENLLEKVKEYTDGRMCECVMEASGANSAIRSTLDLVCHAGRVVFTGWPARETSLPTDIITRKEIDIRGARTSAGEFEEALELISTGKVDVRKILTKLVSVQEAPEVLMDIAANPGNYLKVNVMFD